MYCGKSDFAFDSNKSTLKDFAKKKKNPKSCYFMLVFDCKNLIKKLADAIPI